ncbi:MAG: 4-(cytidine 5'-diphospho)-2-C-methyl-D-erythritol kinase [Gammaproteobacteria bacterium]|nr:4-(cytidine 5'-diphospho)-2-C-methyl-D-erythritol kinase [Gammaproteobacteria bacterium]
MYRWSAPAKLNLFLHITSRRDDGYHELQTLFQFLNFGDQLTFDVRTDGKIQRCTDIPGVPADQDLAVKAAQLLQKKTACTLGVDIRIEKKIPMGGGLGGGSSDAATTLVALNHLWRQEQTPQQLMALGLSLGADVPVFIYGNTAWAEGIGDKLTSVDVPEAWYVVISPNVSIVTAELFSVPELTRDAQALRIRDYFGGVSRDRFKNAFEKLVTGRYPEVGAALNWLSNQADRKNSAMLTGTGGCVFACFDQDEARAREVARQVCRDNENAWTGFCARGCRESPLLVGLKEQIKMSLQ